MEQVWLHCWHLFADYKSWEALESAPCWLLMSQDDGVVCPLKCCGRERFSCPPILQVLLGFVSHASIPFLSRVLAMAFRAWGPLNQTSESRWLAPATAFRWPLGKWSREGLSCLLKGLFKGHARWKKSHLRTSRNSDCTSSREVLEKCLLFTSVWYLSFNLITQRTCIPLQLCSEKQTCSDNPYGVKCSGATSEERECFVSPL